MDIWEVSHLLLAGFVTVQDAIGTVDGNFLGQIPAIDNPDSIPSCSVQGICRVLPMIFIVGLHHQKFGIPGLAGQYQHLLMTNQLG